MASSNSAPPPSSDKSPKGAGKNAGKKPGKSPTRWLLMAGLSVLGLGVGAVLLVVFGLAMAYPNLPELDTLTDYRPKICLLYTSPSPRDS